MNDVAPKELEIVSWECIHVISSAETIRKSEIACRTGFYSCDFSRVLDNRSMFERIAEAVKFPSYFGKNWDALDECLSNLEWLHETRHVLLVEHCGDFSRKNPVS